MARKSNLSASIDTAIANVTGRILTDVVAGLSGSTTLGDLLAELRSREFESHFLALSIDEFVACRGGAAIASAAPRKRGRPAKAVGAAKAAKPAKRGKRGRRAGGKMNTRTAEGRAGIDAKIIALLEEKGEARAEDVRGVIGGSPAQVRASMKRLASEGKVKISGNKRSTTYSLKKR